MKALCIVPNCLNKPTFTVESFHGIDKIPVCVCDEHRGEEKVICKGVNGFVRSM